MGESGRENKDHSAARESGYKIDVLREREKIVRDAVFSIFVFCFYRGTKKRKIINKYTVTNSKLLKIIVAAFITVYD